MPVDSIKPLVQALLAELPDDPTSIVISVKTETDPQAPTNGQKSAATGPAYDPAMVYLLELCTVLALRDKETIMALGADVAESLQNVMRNAASYHSIMISRSMFYLLHLLHAGYVSLILFFPFSHTDFYRNTISSEFQLSSIRYRVLKRTCLIDVHRLSFRV
jgi:brefeldin A-resistance guanine nucleotide exchange factor 1